MIKICMLLVVALILAFLRPRMAIGQTTAGPETVVVHNGSITLHALLWHPNRLLKKGQERRRPPLCSGFSEGLCCVYERCPVGGYRPKTILSKIQNAVLL